MTPEQEATLGPCPLFERDREEVEMYLEQWLMPLGTSHWRIDNGTAWKVAKYVEWLRGSSMTPVDPIQSEERA